MSTSDDCGDHQQHPCSFVEEFKRLTPRLEAFFSEVCQFVQELKRIMPGLLMKDELEQAVLELRKEFRNTVLDPRSRLSLTDQAESSGSRKLMYLHFVCTFPADVIYTFTEIPSKGVEVKVELRDSLGSIVQIGTPGDRSPVKIKIFVLEDRGADDLSPLDFDKNIAQPRNDRGPLLKGNCEFYMNRGVATVTGISFTDNSSRRINRTLRFGARLVKGLPLEEYHVSDGVSKPFTVKERRTCKPPLKLDDGVLQLKHIGPSTRDKLASKGICTVRDFLQKYNDDPDALREMTALTDRKLSEAISNAKSQLSTATNPISMPVANPAFGYQETGDQDEITLMPDNANPDDQGEVLPCPAFSTGQTVYVDGMLSIASNGKLPLDQIGQGSFFPHENFGNRSPSVAEILGNLPFDPPVNGNPSGSMASMSNIQVSHDAINTTAVTQKMASITDINELGSCCCDFPYLGQHLNASSRALKKPKFG